jgi:hypothetical protein
LPPCANVSATTDADGTFTLSVPSGTFGHFRLAAPGYMTTLFNGMSFVDVVCGGSQFDAISMSTPAEVTTLCGSASPTAAYVLVTFKEMSPGSGVCDSSGIVVSVAEVPGAKVTYVDASGNAAPALASTSTMGLACVTGLPTSGVVHIVGTKAGCTAQTGYRWPSPLEAGALTLVRLNIGP